MMDVKIGKAKEVYNVAGSLNISQQRGADGRMQSQTIRTISGQDARIPDHQPVAQHPELHNGAPGSVLRAESLMPDGSLAPNPAQDDASPAHQSSDTDLPPPIQTSSPSTDQERGPEMNFQEDAPQQGPASPPLRTPVPVEGSTDYMSVSRDPNGLNPASPEDPTAMSELKNPYPENDLVESDTHGDAFTSMTESLGQSAVNNTDSEQTARNNQAAHDPLWNDRDLNDRLDESTELKYPAGIGGRDPNLTVDGPEPSFPSSPSDADDGRAAAPVLSSSSPGQSVRSQSASSLAYGGFDDGYGTPAASLDPCDIERDGDRRNTLDDAGEDGFLRSSHRSPNSGPRSQRAEGGRGEGGGEPSARGGIFVFVHRKMLIQDDDDDGDGGDGGGDSREVSVVKVLLNSSVVGDGEKEGVLPGGPSLLAQMKWIGHRDFDVSQWKATLKPEASQPSQTQIFVQHLCQTVSDLDIECLRKVVKQLRLLHNVFLHSLSWEGGLVVCLGHANSDLRDSSMKPPDRDAIRGVLQRLVSSCALDLTWHDPTPLEEEDMENGRPPDSESHVNSASSSALFGPGQTARNVDGVQSTSFQRSDLSESRSYDPSCGSVSESRIRSLTQLLHDIVEEDCRRLVDEHRSRLDPEEYRQQLEQEVMKLIECERKKLEESGQELRRDMEKCQSANHVMSQKLETAENCAAETTQLLNQMRMQLQEQNEAIEQLKASAKVSEKQQEEAQAAREEMKQEMKIMKEKLKDAESKSSQLQQDETKAEDQTSCKEHQSMKDELNKYKEELKEMQQEMLQQKQQQEKLNTILSEYKEMIRQLKTAQPESVVVGMVEAQCEEPEGAVGGSMMTRTSFTSALLESEKTTSKIKGKDEEMGSNQIDVKIHPMGTIADSFGQASAIPGMEPDPESKDNPASNLTSGTVSPQGGARSKTSQKSLQGQTKVKGNGSPMSGRKLSTCRESSQERAPDRPASEEPEEDPAKVEQFLEWIQFSPGSKNQKKNIFRQIGAALKEETVPAPRAKCLDTILCIDVSDSIVAEGHLDTVKNTAMEFVDGIEDMMNDMEMEENVAVVAMAGSAKVVQHLTNDLTLVRDAIASLDGSGGRSPFIQALMVCLAANKGRGGVLNVAGVYKVRPRIIFITDGFPTDEAQDRGPDLNGNFSQAKFSLVNFLSQLQSRKFKTVPRPICWVPVGKKADKQFLESLAELNGGEFVMPDEIRGLCRHYKVQQTIGRLFKMVKEWEDNLVQDGKIRDVLEAMAAHTITAEEKNFIVETVKKLRKFPQEEEDPEADDFSRVFEDEVKVKSGELLPLGTRVVKGPDWKWKNQDTDGPGTVIQHSNKDNWLYVKWDNGTHNAYRYGEGGKTDVVETQHHPRQIPPDSDRLDFGVRVIRGPDWKSENEDGQGLGSVVRCRESDGKVKVRWDITGRIVEYHYRKKREVQLSLPEFPRTGHVGNTGNGHKQELDESKTIAMWKWLDERRQWRLYDKATCEKLEEVYTKRPNGSSIVTRAGKDRRVSFKLWQEKTVVGGSRTDVLREMVDEERKNDLLAIEMSLSGDS